MVKSSRSVKRPLIIIGLSMVMISASLALIYLRIQNLRSLPNLNSYVETIRNQDSGLPLEVMSVNAAFFSNIAILSTSFIPLVLGIGLWNLYGWARAISICLFISILIPRTFAALGLIEDHGSTMMANLGVSIGCAIGLAILFHPKIVMIFRKKGNIC